MLVVVDADRSSCVLESLLAVGQRQVALASQGSLGGRRLGRLWASSHLFLAAAEIALLSEGRLDEGRRPSAVEESLVSEVCGLLERLQLEGEPATEEDATRCARRLRLIAWKLSAAAAAAELGSDRDRSR